MRPERSWAGSKGGVESMNKRIVGFHLDEEQHWVAELECGHNQHVHHNPPWTIVRG